MNKRITEKLKKNGRYDEMSKRYQSRRGGPVRDSSPKNWDRGYFIGERNLRDYYLAIQSLDSKNPLLRYLVLDKDNHVKIKPTFAQEQWPGKDYSTPSEEDYKRSERMNKGKIRETYRPLVILTLQTLLSQEYKLLSKMRIVEKEDAKIKGIEQRLLTQEA
jgi:hypothetical protein